MPNLDPPKNLVFEGCEDHKGHLFSLSYKSSRKNGTFHRKMNTLCGKALFWPYFGMIEQLITSKMVYNVDHVPHGHPGPHDGLQHHGDHGRHGGHPEHGEGGQGRSGGGIDPWKPSVA